MHRHHRIRKIWLSLLGVLFFCVVAYGGAVAVFIDPATCGNGLMYMGVDRTWKCVQGVHWYDLKEFGITGNGISDDSATLQTLISGAPNFSTFVCGHGMRMKISRTINIHNQQGLRFTGFGGNLGQSVDNSLDTNGPCQFFWAGAAGGRMFSVDRARDLRFEYIVFDAGASGSNANQLIDLDQTGTGNIITTNVSFDNVVFRNGVSNVNFIGLDIGQGANSQNNEHMTIENSQVLCTGKTGSGIRIDGSNSKDIKIINSTFTNCAVGIQFLNGSGVIRGNLFADEVTDIEVSNGTETYFIDGNITEGFTQYFIYGKRACCSYLSAVIMGNAIHTGGAADFPGAGVYPSILTGVSTVLMGNTWAESATLIPVQSGSPGNDGLFSTQNYFPNKLTSWMDAFAAGDGGYISIMDRLHTVGGGNFFHSRINNSKLGIFRLPNDIGLSGYDGDGTTARNLIKMDTSNNIILGATTNALKVNALTTTGAASGKKVVCVDTTTGQLYASSTGTACDN